MSISSSDSVSVFRPLWLRDLKQGAAPEVDWLWRGYLAAGNLTLLTSQWKAGKTTLLALLLDRMKGGGELAGLPVKAGKAVVLSEEAPTLWLERSRRFDFQDHVCWFCRPFPRRPRPEEWLALIDQLLALHEQVGLSLLAIDPLAAFFPVKSENDADAMLAALLPLQRLTQAGLAVAVLHHPRKKASEEGQSARGSGALCGHADILLELHWYAAASDEDRRRRLLAWSRHEATPRRRTIELSADGREYVVVADAEEEKMLGFREVLWWVLREAATKQTREDIERDWPPEHPKPHPATLWRLLERCVEAGELKRDAAGTKNDPFRYWLPSLEERWKKDVLARVEQTTQDVERAARLGFRVPIG